MSTSGGDVASVLWAFLGDLLGALLGVSTLAMACGGGLACGATPAMRAAEAGDYAALQTSLTGRSDVDLGEARDIARRVLTRDIETAQGITGRRGLDAIGRCARRVADSIDRRSQHDDELGAFAARLRVDLGLAPPLAYAPRLDDPAPYWRAAAARSMGLPASSSEEMPRTRGDLERAGIWRRQLMLDPSGEVRIAALRAAVDAADSEDLVAVLEAARLDPEPEARLMAIQAAGAIGTREAVLRLVDLWPRSDEEARLAIVGAWAAAARKPRRDPGPDRCMASPGTESLHPRCVALGQLRRISDQSDGMPSLVAALELIHDTPPARAGTPEGHAAAVVERMIDGASTRVRIEAILSAPSSWPHLLEAIVDASKDHDDRVAAAALSRMTELGGVERDEALAKLRELAADDGLAADRAKQALVDAGDRQVVPLLASDVKAASAEQRAEAAERYARLGQVTEALGLVADRDVTVRARAACAILALED